MHYHDGKPCSGHHAQEQEPSEQEKQLARLVQSLQAQLSVGSTHSTRTPKPHDAYKFWRTQPVPRIDETVTEETTGPIEPAVPIDDVRQAPYALPPTFEWCSLDLNTDEHLDEVFTLLKENYVEDEDVTFRFAYPKELLKWAVMPPGWKKDWLAGVRVSNNKKLVAFISAVPVHVHIHSHEQDMVEINFLCVHKKLRAKRLAPVMIKEITRRVHLQGIFQAIYTSGSYLPKPVSVATYFHRPLNPKKLIDTNFSTLKKNMTMARTIKLFKVPEEYQTAGFRPIEMRDAEQVCALLKSYQSRYELRYELDLKTVKHRFLSNVADVKAYVVEDSTTKKITDFVSFYTIPTLVIDHPVHDEIRAAYLYHYATTEGQERLHLLMRDALIAAKKTDHDVFNCTDVMDNQPFLEDLKFGRGSGTLKFYLYNYRCKEVPLDKMGVVLL